MTIHDLVFLTTLFQLIALVLAWINFSKYRKSTEKWFLFFLIYTMVTELIGIYKAYYLKIYDLTVYHIFIIVSFLFYFFWYQKILEKTMQKNIVRGLSALFFIYGLYNLVTLSWDQYHYKTFILGAIINILASIFFFAQLLNDKKEIEVAHNLKFWIATGLLLFNVGMVPFMLFSEEFNAKSGTRTIILVTLNLILYGCYSLGFILCKKPTEN